MVELTCKSPVLYTVTSTLITGEPQVTETRSEEYPPQLGWFRYFRAFMLYTFGISKPLHLQFDLQSQLARQPVGSLTGYQLTWFYFGYSRIYAVLLGITQVIGGTLLLFRKTTLLGALTMLPIMANILLIDMFVLVNDYGPYFISGLICVFLSAIVWHQRSGLMSLLWTSQSSEPVSLRGRHRLIAFTIAFAATAMMLAVGLIQRHVKHSRA